MHQIGIASWSDTPMTMTKEESFSRGFDRGNYGNAYESQDWESWYAEHCESIPDDADREAYQEGMLLGFFSSYELSEIGDACLVEEVSALRAKHGEDVDEDPSEPEEEDWVTSDHKAFYQNGKRVLTLTGEESEAEMWAHIERAMSDANYWPNVWFVSDHGNAHLMTRPAKKGGA